MDEVLLVFPRFKYPSGDPPLGVAYLAACLREAGCAVGIFDATFVRNAHRELGALVATGRFRVVAITALTSMLQDVARSAQIVKEVSPKTLVIVGGPHATVEPQGTAALPGVDAVHRGEGELSFPALVASGYDYRNVPGFSYLEEGEFIDNGCAPVPEDLDAIPYPAWDLLPMDRYLGLWYQLDAVAYGLRGTSVIASRGCPYNCSYCQPTLRKIFGAKVRRRSVENVLGELMELKARYKLDGVMWLDDTFLLDRRWVMDLCAAITEARLELLWGCNLRADVVDRECLAAMKEAGLRIVHIGIESASQRILDEVYNKGITVDQVREAVAIAKDLGLSVRGYFMLGAPGETEEEAWSTVKLATTLPIDDATFSITTPLPHTHLWDKTQHLVTRATQDFDYYKVPVYGAGEVIPPRRLVYIKRVAYLRFYLGRRLWRTVRSVAGWSGLRKALLKVKRF